MADWTEEQLRAGFNTERHPRTMIGTTQGRPIWLVTVDGRNPQVSLGMTFAELQTSRGSSTSSYALNLDGGGSTTMVVKGTIVNHPSDATGPRKVSDGFIVVSRSGRRTAGFTCPSPCFDREIAEQPPSSSACCARARPRWRPLPPRSAPAASTTS